MIERYSRKVMRDVWTEENKFNAYLEVEILSCEAWSKLGVIPSCRLPQQIIRPTKDSLTTRRMHREQAYHAGHGPAV